jgi:hypothetical protein
MNLLVVLAFFTVRDSYNKAPQAVGYLLQTPAKLTNFVDLA